MEIYPKPRQVKWGECIGYLGRIHVQGRREFWQNFNEDNTLHIGIVEVDLYLGECPDPILFDEYRSFMVEEEGYFLQIKKISEQKASVWVTATSKRGYYYAYLTWQQICKQSLKEGWIIDNPGFPFRGLVEGYYGAPWSIQDRLRAFEVMSSHKMNTYIYAPKNDRYHRDLWRKPYPAYEQQKIKQLINGCDAVSIEFVFSLSPGFSIKYSSVNDIQDLITKFGQLYLDGVKFFGLFFDDIPHTLQHDEDIHRFGSLVQAQIFLIVSVFAELKKIDPKNRLMICPTVYFGEGNEEYITTLGKALPNEIHILWTGRRICSPEITAREARYFYEQTRHKPFYWDNYPVNDANMRDEMHIGPLVGRDPLLSLYSAGYVANVMEYSEASLIPLITASHYLWNPDDYEPNCSYSIAVQQIVGKNLYKDFLILSECINQSSISPLPGNHFMMEWFTHHRMWGERKTQEQYKSLILDYRKKALGLLEMDNKRLAKELKLWLEQLIRDFDYLLSIVRVTEVEDSKERRKLAQELKDWSDTQYAARVKALGFFPQLIANEILEKEE